MFNYVPSTYWMPSIGLGPRDARADIPTTPAWEKEQIVRYLNCLCGGDLKDERGWGEVEGFVGRGGAWAKDLCSKAEFSPLLPTSVPHGQAHTAWPLWHITGSSCGILLHLTPICRCTCEQTVGMSRALWSARSKDYFSSVSLVCHRAGLQETQWDIHSIPSRFNTHQDPLGSPGPHCLFSHFTVPLWGSSLEKIERLEAQALPEWL